MAAKRKITIKKKVKNVEKVAEIEENAVTTVEENEISDAKVESGTIIQAEQEIGLKKPELRKKKKKSQVIWDIGWTEVVKPEWRIKFEAQVAPFPMFKVPEDIRRYLVSHGLTTEVYKKSKEWLEKHKVDPEVVEKLKKFLTERL